MRIRFEPVTDEGVASLAGSGNFDRKTSGIYIVKVYDENDALLTVPGATRSNFKVRCNETDLETAENNIREEFTKHIQAATQNRLISQSWYGLDISTRCASSSINCSLSVRAQLSTMPF